MAQAACRGHIDMDLRIKRCPHTGRKIFPILGREDLGIAEAAPGVELRRFVQAYGVGAQVDIRHGALQFQHGTRHVIARRDYDQRTHLAAFDPTLGFDGVADGIAGLIVHVDAAIEQFAVLRQRIGETFGRSRSIDAGDQQPLGAAIGQKIDSVGYALGAAGQRDDAIGRRRRGAPLIVERVHEGSKTRNKTGKQRHAQNYERTSKIAHGGAIGAKTG